MENDMDMNNERGSIKISSDVVLVIAASAVNEIKGLTLTGGLTNDFVEMLGVKSQGKGVKVQIGENDTKIDLFVITDYGVRIPEVAAKAQESVKRTVEAMTGLFVSEVNVHVQGINTHKEQKNTDDAPEKGN